MKSQKYPEVQGTSSAVLLAVNAGTWAKVPSVV
jgi:hypothetical protein